MKEGTLVELSCPFTIDACELLGSCETLPLEVDGLWLLEDSDTGVDVCEGVRTRPELCWLEDGVADPRVGVMKEVKRMVSALCVANGLPLRSENVTAGMICVKTVNCIGSTTTAVFALTS